MAYNVADIINKAVKITIRKKAIYEKIGQDKSDILSIKIISKVLVKELDKTIQYYERVLNEINDVEFEEIDFSIYDKMSFLINDFNQRLNIVEINNVREYLKYSLDLEKSVHSLLMNIQGRFVLNTSDVHTKTYKILTDIIDNKASHIEMLEKTIE